MNKIDRLFREGRLTRWLNERIDVLVCRDHPFVNELRNKTGLYTFALIALSFIASLVICRSLAGDHVPVPTNTTILFSLYGIIAGAVLSIILNVWISWFYTRRFLFHYRKFVRVFSLSTGNFMRSIHYVGYDRSATTDADGPIFCALASLFKELLIIERDCGDGFSEHPTWINMRSTFEESYNLFVDLGLVKDPDKGWSPYKRRAIEDLSTSESHHDAHSVGSLPILPAEQR